MPNPELKTLLEEWQSLKEILPEGMPPDQERQLYLAFHAGALCALDLVSEASARLPEDQATALLQRTWNEAGAATRTVFQNVPGLKRKPGDPTAEDEALIEEALQVWRVPDDKKEIMRGVFREVLRARVSASLHAKLIELMKEGPGHGAD